MATPGHWVVQVRRPDHPGGTTAIVDSSRYRLADRAEGITRACALIHLLCFRPGGHAAPAYACLGRTKDQWGLLFDLRGARSNAACCVTTCTHTLKINARVCRVQVLDWYGAATWAFTRPYSAAGAVT